MLSTPVVTDKTKFVFFVFANVFIQQKKLEKSEAKSTHNRSKIQSTHTVRRRHTCWRLQIVAFLFVEKFEIHLYSSPR